MAGAFENQNRGPSGSTLLPHFFGEPGRELFGVYHAPQGVAARPAGGVLC
jgi:hypothetical protein